MGRFDYGIREKKKFPGQTMTHERVLENGKWGGARVSKKNRKRPITREWGKHGGDRGVGRREKIHKIQLIYLIMIKERGGKGAELLSR